MKNILILILSATFCFNLSAQDEKINWVSFEEALELNENEPKKFFIDFYTDWCGWCKRLDAVTFKDKEVIELINKHYYAIKFDAERKDTIVFQDKDYVFVPNGRRGYHTLAAALMKNKMSYPTMLIMEIEQKTENVIFHNPLSGYMEGAAIEPILQYLGERLYLDEVDWTEYKENYASKQ